MALPENRFIVVYENEINWSRKYVTSEVELIHNPDHLELFKVNKSCTINSGIKANHVLDEKTQPR